MSDFLNEIPKATEIRQSMMNNETYKSQISKYIRWTNESIEDAKSEGLTKTLFNVSPEYETEIKIMYERQGYKFEPYGYSSGVWQLCENICW